MFAQVAGAFPNARVRRHGRAYLLGLLSQQERKTSWQLAEFAGDATPDGLQKMLNSAPWDEDACRDALARYVVRKLGDPGAVLAADETGFLKKGRMSAGVARMYTGTAGRVENCRAAGIGDGLPFATKGRLARQMFARAVKAGVPFRWAAGDEVYGASPELREWLEEHGKGYVLAVVCSAMIETKAGAKRADELAALVPAEAWQRISCADGSKGPRLYDWALIGTDRDDRHLMVRRSLRPGRRASWSWRSTAATRRSRSRWPSSRRSRARAGEDCFAEAKNEAGLDHYQVRRYRAWYRHVTLSMLAHAFLAVAAHAARPPSPVPALASGNTGSVPAKKGT